MDQGPSVNKGHVGVFHTLAQCMYMSGKIYHCRVHEGCTYGHMQNTVNCQSEHHRNDKENRMDA